MNTTDWLDCTLRFISDLCPGLARVLNSRYSISSAVLNIVYKNYKDFLIASITDHLFLRLRKAMLATNF